MASDSEGKLVRLSHTHEAVLNWLILNPECSLRECADHFGYTQPWLSSMIHSDLFQEALKQKQARVEARIISSIPEKLRKVADVALDKLADKVAETEDPEFLLDATDKILHRMGYAPQSSRNPGGPPGVGQQQNNFFISAGDLTAARELIGRGQAQALGPIPTEPEKEIQGEVLP